MYLVDTNILSEARRKSPEAIRWLRGTSPDLLRISVITLGEIMRGVAAKERKDREAADQLRRWLAILRQDFADRIEAIDARVAIEWGRLAALKSRGEADGLIAATAIVKDLTLVTRNVTDFDDLPVRMINPWDV